MYVKRIISNLKLPYVLVKEFWYAYLTPKQSYSQFGEDLIFEKKLKNLKGNYLEVGSGRPVSGNNTWKLYKRGWNGICVDPIRKNSILHKVLRPKDKFYCAIIGNNFKMLDFYETYPYEYSSTNLENIKNLIFNNQAVLLRKYQVSSLPINQLMNLLGRIDLLSIDAEGMDLEILSSINFDIHAPIFICVEDHQFYAETSAINKLLLSNKYKLVSKMHPSYLYELRA